MIIIALKSVFLVGIMSWYSMAVLTMINDYFRSEFHNYLKENPADAYKSNTIQHTVQIPSKNIEISQVSSVSSINHPGQINEIESGQPNYVRMAAEMVGIGNRCCHIVDYIQHIFLVNRVCLLTSINFNH